MVVSYVTSIQGGVGAVLCGIYLNLLFIGERLKRLRHFQNLMQKVDFARHRLQNTLLLLQYRLEREAKINSAGDRKES